MLVYALCCFSGGWWHLGITQSLCPVEVYAIEKPCPSGMHPVGALCLRVHAPNLQTLMRSPCTLLCRPFKVVPGKDNKPMIEGLPLHPPTFFLHCKHSLLHTCQRQIHMYHVSSGRFMMGVFPCCHIALFLLFLYHHVLCMGRGCCPQGGKFQAMCWMIHFKFLQDAFVLLPHIQRNTAFEGAHCCGYHG